MRTLEELRVFYDTKLVKELTALEQQRQNALQIAVVGIVVAAVILVAALLVTVATGVPPVAIGGVILAVIAFAAISSIGRKDYVYAFKSTVIRPLVSFIDPGLGYYPAEYISQGDFERSRIFSIKPDRYSGEDLVKGKVGATQIAFSEVHAEYKTTTTDSKGHTHTHWHTIFRGLLFTGDFNKHFQGTTIVVTDVAERLFGRLGQKLQGMTLFSDLKLVKLEDPEFEKLFVVYSQDQIEARYILSTSLMQRIVQFRKRTGKEISMSFVGSRIFVAIPQIKPLFEPRVFRTLLDFNAICEYFEDMNMAVGIVDELNLNTRIWSKE